MIIHDLDIGDIAHYGHIGRRQKNGCLSFQPKIAKNVNLWNAITENIASSLSSNLHLATCLNLQGSVD